MMFRLLILLSMLVSIPVQSETVVSVPCKGVVPGTYTRTWLERSEDTENKWVRRTDTVTIINTDGNVITIRVDGDVDIKEYKLEMQP